jgi:hypothetical protein
MAGAAGDEAARRLAAVVGLAVVLAGGAARAAGSVLCQATHATTCAPGSGCEPDRRRAELFTVDLAAGQIRDADGNAYTIRSDAPPPSDPRPASPPLPGGEYVLVATATLSGGAQETLVIGEQSFLATRVSLLPPRADVQVGTCAGLAPPPEPDPDPRRHREP